MTEDHIQAANYAVNRVARAYRPKLIPSGIEPKRDDTKAFLDKAREIGDFVEGQLKNFFLDLVQQQAYALERLEEWTPTERLLTLKEAAVYLGFKSRTLDSWTAPGREPLIQFRILGGEKRFRKKWLDDAVDNGSVKPREVVKL